MDANVMATLRSRRLSMTIANLVILVTCIGLAWLVPVSSWPKLWWLPCTAGAITLAQVHLIRRAKRFSNIRFVRNGNLITVQLNEIVLGRSPSIETRGTIEEDLIVTLRWDAGGELRLGRLPLHLVPGSLELFRKHLSCIAEFGVEIDSL